MGIQVGLGTIKNCRKKETIYNEKPPQKLEQKFNCKASERPLQLDDDHIYQHFLVKNKANSYFLAKLNNTKMAKMPELMHLTFLSVHPASAASYFFWLIMINNIIRIIRGFEKYKFSKRKNSDEKQMSYNLRVEY